MMVHRKNINIRKTQWLREPAAEFAGVMILVIFGAGAGCQANLSTNTGDPATFAFGWAVGLSLAVWISAGISGGHVNPAVTLSLAIFRGFPWRKAPVYMIAQLLGGIIYANYFHAIDIVEGGRGIRTLATAGIFSTFAYIIVPVCVQDEFWVAIVATFELGTNSRGQEEHYLLMVC
ncbi:aquaporin-like protein [Dendrothele bispora CBS 962.96]|uniref:Aquaporin-like protein n=1 Tax=Dendrothele bispora (strain CBS 962.96) TaxID=1314807 RepID=A0A4S8LQ91_DENBC|nr:aquaporin-like protein [Dendrothele bispora CBS 962.96]